MGAQTPMEPMLPMPLGMEWCTKMVEWDVNKLDDLNGFSLPYNDHL